MNCIECGREESGRCNCCGLPLCHMHMETQGGFCSQFGSYKFSEGEKVIVTDSLNDLNKDKIKILEEVELNGCISGLIPVEGDENRLFTPMHELPRGKDKPVSELRKANYEVLKADE